MWQFTIVRDFGAKVFPDEGSEEDSLIECGSGSEKNLAMG